MTAASVLLVEDHNALRSALRDWLLTSFPPLRLREARSAEEAIRHAEQARLDLVLMDVGLPGMDGIACTREILSRLPTCTVVVISANDADQRRDAALRAGAAAFVSKRDLHLALRPLLEQLMCWPA